MLQVGGCRQQACIHRAWLAAAFQGLQGVPIAGVREVAMGASWVPRVAVRVCWGTQWSHGVVSSSFFGLGLFWGWVQ